MNVVLPPPRKRTDPERLAISSPRARRARGLPALAASLVAATLAASALAAPPSPPSGGAPPSPPPEAFAACSSAKDGDACTVTFGDQSIAGTCVAFGGGSGLACRPNQMPPPRPLPPEQAFDACASSKEDDACTVTHGDHSLSGTCAKGPDGRLACRPEPPR